MSATDELRRMLDERDVEWEDMSARFSTGMLRCTSWTSQDGEPCTALEGADDISDGKLSVQALLTSAQAIAATLGAGACVNMDGETDAEWFTCSECNTELRVHEPFDAFSIHFCPNCGRKVVDE